MKAAGFDIDLELFNRYAGLALPRHVAYPMPTWWSDMTADEARDVLAGTGNGRSPRDLSIYVHVPFCEQLCRYCACTRVPLSRKSKDVDERTDAYVAAVLSEIDQLVGVLGRRRVRQIHWGGGTPTFLTCERLRRIHDALAGGFELAPEAEVAIELDPRVTSEEMLVILRELGFTRVSFGVQDFDEAVQSHVGRVQPFAMVKRIVERCRELGFVSVNFDLIYGLPLQTPATIERTIAQTIELSPDRVAYYLFAQIPDKIAVQRGLDYTRLPDSVTKLGMFLTGVQRFTEAGYEFVGLDHFAKPDEPLVKAKREGTLQRNFQGMTTGGGLDLIGIGASSISHLAESAYLQNVREVAAYQSAIEAQGSAVYRGKRFTDEDVVRQAVLSDWYCYGGVDPRKIEWRHGIVFEEYFARELDVMRELADDGLVRFAVDGALEATMPLGRVLMRTIGAVFDGYLAPDAYRVGDRQYFSANA